MRKTFSTFPIHFLRLAFANGAFFFFLLFRFVSKQTRRRLALYYTCWLFRTARIINKNYEPRRERARALLAVRVFFSPLFPFLRTKYNPKTSETRTVRDAAYTRIRDCSFVKSCFLAPVYFGDTKLFAAVVAVQGARRALLIHSTYYYYTRRVGSFICSHALSDDGGKPDK